MASQELMVLLLPDVGLGCVQEVVVLDTKVAMKATEEILGMHSIPSVVSSDLANVVAAARSGAAEAHETLAAAAQ